MIETPPQKREALEGLLGSGPAMIHFDPRRDGVLAPAELCTGPVLRLKLSWHYAHPLHFDEEGIVQTLTFASGSFRCAVPWEAIFAMGPADAQPSWVWPNDLPPEMRNLLASAALPDTEEVDVPPEGHPLPAPLAALVEQDEAADDETEGDDPPDDPSDDDPPGTIRRGHLRLVK